MAITYIDSTVGTATAPASGDWTLPAGWADGDIGVFWWYAMRPIATVAEPVEVTQKYDVSDAEVTYGRLFIGYRVLQTGDTTFTWTSNSSTGVDVVFGVDVFRGVDTTGDPFEAESGSPASFLNVNDPDPPAVTPVSDNAAIWTIFGKSNDYTGVTQPTNYTLGETASLTAGNDASAGTAYRIMSGGAGVPEDPGAWDLAGGISTDDGWTWTGALKPEAVGGGRASKNTSTAPLGMELGMHLWMGD